jgi:hypothetical protein
MIVDMIVCMIVDMIVCMIVDMIVCMIVVMIVGTIIVIYIVTITYHCVSFSFSSPPVAFLNRGRGGTRGNLPINDM